MRNVYENLLYCGDMNDYPPSVQMEHWAVVHACKDPMHRSLVGYTSKGCPKDSPHYYFIEKENRIALNIVDAPKPEFFDKRMIDKALDFIELKLSEGFRVLVHCNVGESRSASICLLYLIKHSIIKGETLEDCEAEFLKVYPEYNPGAGIRGFVKEHFAEYRKHGHAGKKTRSDATKCNECEYCSSGRCGFYDNAIIADVAEKQCFPGMEMV